MNNVPDYIWRNNERRLAAKERPRLIRLGHIVPAVRMKPQMMDKTLCGLWVPRVGGNI